LRNSMEERGFLAMRVTFGELLYLCACRAWKVFARLQGERGIVAENQRLRR
jgi:hypothetical protein